MPTSIERQMNSQLYAFSFPLTRAWLALAILLEAKSNGENAKQRLRAYYDYENEVAAINEAAATGIDEVTGRHTGTPAGQWISELTADLNGSRSWARMLAEPDYDDHADSVTTSLRPICERI